MALSKGDKFQLPSDYYRKVNPVITALVIFFAWILFPVMVLKPALLAPIVDDWMIKVAVANHSSLLKFFQIHIWIHAIESIIAIQKCRRLGINSNTTLHWTASVAVHGIFALKYLLWPDKAVKKISVH